MSLRFVCYMYAKPLRQRKATDAAGATCWVAHWVRGLAEGRGHCVRGLTGCWTGGELGAGLWQAREWAGADRVQAPQSSAPRARVVGPAASGQGGKFTARGITLGPVGCHKV